MQGVSDAVMQCASGVVVQGAGGRGQGASVCPVSSVLFT